MLKRIFFFIFFLAVPLASAADQIGIGAQYDGWDTSATLQSSKGWEILEPLSLSLHLDRGIKVYGQTAFASGQYNDPFNGITDLNNFTDTIIGGEFTFKVFSVSSMLNIGINIPTGNPAWEAQQVNSVIPVEFIDSSYRGRGFGLSALYALDLPQGGGGEFGVAAGYLYSGAFNPSYGTAYTPDTSLKLGDSVFLSLNHLQRYSGRQTEVMRASAFYFLTTQQDGSDSFQMGSNVNASYAWNNPDALSFEIGGQYYFRAQRLIGKTSYGIPALNTETNTSFAPRFYLTPSYAFDRDFSIGAKVKYIMPNGYSTNDPEGLYDGGGWVFGVEPTLRLWIDSGSSLKLTAGYDDVIAINGDTTHQNDVYYYYWTFGTTYEVKL